MFILLFYRTKGNEPKFDFGGYSDISRKGKNAVKNVNSFSFKFDN